MSKFCAAAISCVFLIFCVWANELAWAANDEVDAVYIEQLVERASLLSLGASEGWLRLGHYQKGRLGKLESEADGAAFFLAENGKFDPESELEATIRAVFSPAKDPTSRLHPFCQFPARLMFIAEALQVDLSRVPRQDCPTFQTYLRELNPQGVSYIFSSYYINQPASAFGHTFLKVDKRAGRFVGSQRQELLDTGIDFAATVDTNNAILYAFKGLFGFFPGVYKKLPYYYKVREYNDYESRDLWSYELNLSDQQLLMLLSHLWELGTTHFDYYYISENCSYHILGALEAALPELELVSETKNMVLPADTVKILKKQENLIGDIHYRPALRTQFNRRIEVLNRHEQQSIFALAKDPVGTSLSDYEVERQVLVLDAAADYVDLRYSDEILMDKDGEAAQLKQKILERRAKIPIASIPLKFEAPELGMAHNSHGSSRLQVAAGTTLAENGQSNSPFVQLNYRLNLHDLADTPVGYPNLGQIEILPITARYDLISGRPYIETAYFLDLVSLVSVSRFDLSLSNEYRFGLRRSYESDCYGCLLAVGELGNGFAKSTMNEAVVAYVMALVGVQGAPGYDGLLSSPAAVYIGPSAGLRVRLRNNLLFLGRYQWHYRPFLSESFVHKGDVQVRWSPSQNTAFGLKANLYALHKEALVTGYWYF